LPKLEKRSTEVGGRGRRGGQGGGQYRQGKGEGGENGTEGNLYVNRKDKEVGKGGKKKKVI